MLKVGSAAILAVLCAAVALPSYSQNSNIRRTNGMVDTNGLEPVQMYRAPLRVQYVDKRPIITSIPHEQPAESYVFPSLESLQRQRGSVPGATEVGNNIYVMGGNQPQGVRTTIPGIEPLNNLPQSSFGTNIPEGGVRPRTMLPSGRSTGLLGRMKQPSFGATTTPFRQPTPVSRQMDSANQTSSPVAAMTYGPNQSIGSSSSVRTSTSTTIKMLNKVK